MIDLGNNEQGKALSAKTINKGDNYGLNDCLTYNDADIYFKEKDPLIEFYQWALPLRFNRANSNICPGTNRLQCPRA